MATSSYLATLPPLPLYEERPDGCHDGEEISLERYLNTMYHPDCDYIDGHLEERNTGEIEHSRIQKRLLLLFIQHEAEWQVEVLQEQRMQVSPANFRIPDVIVLRADHTEHRVVRRAPVLLIEIFSPEDSIQRLHERVRDYVKMGWSTSGPSTPPIAPPTAATLPTSTSSPRTNSPSQAHRFVSSFPTFSPPWIGSDAEEPRQCRGFYLRTII